MATGQQSQIWDTSPSRLHWTCHHPRATTLTLCRTMTPGDRGVATVTLVCETEILHTRRSVRLHSTSCVCDKPSMAKVTTVCVTLNCLSRSVRLHLTSRVCSGEIVQNMSNNCVLCSKLQTSCCVFSHYLVNKLRIVFQTANKLLYL